MKVYTVHRPAVPSHDPLDQVDELIFVRDGFSWLGLLFAPLWLLANRLWIEFGFFVFGSSVLFALIQVTGADFQILSIGWLFAALVIGFEGNNLRRMDLDRTVHQMIGTVSGANQYECELKFLSLWAPDQYGMKQTEELIPGTPLGTAKLSEQ